MRKLKSLWLVSVVLLLVSCSMSAKSDKSSEAGTASKGEVVTLNKAEFLQKVFNYEKNATKWVYEGDKPCIIDFYADWCGPCKQVAPILRDLAILYKNDIVVYKVNVDKEIWEYACGKELQKVYKVFLRSCLSLRKDSLRYRWELFPVRSL